MPLRSLAETGKKGGSARLAGRNLWLVHRRLWHRRLENRQSRCL